MSLFALKTPISRDFLIRADFKKLQEKVPPNVNFFDVVLNEDMPDDVPESRRSACQEVRIQCRRRLNSKKTQVNKSISLKKIKKEDSKWRDELDKFTTTSSKEDMRVFAEDYLKR